ncbi:hypothetical protein HYV70_04455 [Candidatus Uhrbacteria bacterium]|nr:hypothetical protein [Candidatus Uhrbacteria bacterium]
MRSIEQPICSHCGYPLHIGEHASNCPTRQETKTNILERRIETKELIPEFPGLVIKEQGFLGAGPTEFCKPLFRVSPQDASSEYPQKRLEIKETPSMGKAAFIEQTSHIDGIDYHFLQWKGIGSNANNEQMQQKAEQAGGSWAYPLGKRGVAPLFFLEVKGKQLLRFRGAAFYGDLLLEARQTQRFASYHLRMPKIVETIKFDREFAQTNNLPVPESDNPQDTRGEGLLDFIERHKGQIDPIFFKKLLNAQEFKDGYESAILGENIRAFRNIWRVDDVEKVLKESESSERTDKLRLIIESSRQILSQERKQELTAEEFLSEYARLLGQQAGIFIENRLNQGALLNHKQDITLAAEICDFDGAYIFNDEYLSNPEHLPSWVKDDETKKEWIEEQQLRIDRQVLFIAAHYQPVFDAISTIEGRTYDIKDVTQTYTEGLVQELSEKQKKRLTQTLLLPEFSRIEVIVGDDHMTKENFSGYQDLFNSVTSTLLEMLK